LGKSDRRPPRAIIAALEDTEACAATASGMAAITGTVLSICESGAHVVAPHAMYGESARLLRERLPKLGITTTFVDGTPASYEAALRPDTRILYIETPANPTLAIVDIAAIVAPRERAATLRRFATTPRDPVRALTRARRRRRDPLDDQRGRRSRGRGGRRRAWAIERSSIAFESLSRGLGAPLQPLAAWLMHAALERFRFANGNRARPPRVSRRSSASIPASRASIIHRSPLIPDTQKQKSKCTRSDRSSPSSSPPRRRAPNGNAENNS
jgi:hypothetical protein